MITKTLTFENASGETVTEEWCFNISKAELAEQMLMRGDDLEKILRTIAEERKGDVILPEFKKILTMAVGKRAENGRQLVKGEVVINDFLYSGAYDALFMEILTNPDSGAAFINSLLPKGLIDESEKIKAEKANTISYTEGLQKLSGSDTIESSAQPGTDDLSEEAMSEDELRAMLMDDEGFKPVVEEDNRPAWLKDMRLPTKNELKAMGKEELKLAMRLKSEGKLNRANAPA